MHTCTHYSQGTSCTFLHRSTVVGITINQPVTRTAKSWSCCTCKIDPNCGGDKPIVHKMKQDLTMKAQIHTNWIQNLVCQKWYSLVCQNYYHYSDYYYSLHTDELIWILWIMWIMNICALLVWSTLVYACMYCCFVEWRRLIDGRHTSRWEHSLVDQPLLLWFAGVASLLFGLVSVLCYSSWQLSACQPCPQPTTSGSHR